MRTKKLQLTYTVCRRNGNLLQVAQRFNTTHYSTETLEHKHQFNKNPQCEVLITQTPSGIRMRNHSAQE
jgi:hypothetical protein